MTWAPPQPPQHDQRDHGDHGDQGDQGVGRHEPAPGEPRHGVPARIVEAILGAGLVVAAAALSLAGVPVPVRTLVVLPVILGVAGRGATLLLLQRRLTPLPDTRSGTLADHRADTAGGVVRAERPSRDGARVSARTGVDPGDLAVVDEQTLRAVSPVLFGVIAGLAAILAVSAVRVTITPTTVTVASAVVAGVLHVAAAFVRRDVPAVPRSVAQLADVGRLVVPVVAVLAALALLVAGVAGARSVEAERVEHYTQLSLVDPGVYATGGLRAKPGARFQVGWVLKSYAMGLDTTPPVALTVAGAKASGVQRRALEPPADVTDAEASRRGLVSALAPSTAGLYRVTLTVGAGDQAQTLYLVLEVASR